MRRTYKFYLVCLMVFCTSSVARAQPLDFNFDWKLKRDRDGIQVYLSRVKGSKFKAIRSTMDVKAQTNSLVALVMDLPNCSNWAAMCKEAYIQQRLSLTESYVYTRNDIPFPVRDRDVVALVKWSQDRISGKVSMVSRATKGKFPKKKGIIRIEDAVSEWHFTPLKDGLVRVESFAHIDPNGVTPAWLTNMLMVDSPYKTMKNMRNILREGDYKDAQIAFLSDLPE